MRPDLNLPDPHIPDGWSATGYSGTGEAKNNPAMEDRQNFGPIPRGDYQIGAACTSQHQGPLTMPLVPMQGEQAMHGRSAFMIHGDSINSPGCASHGCIIMPHAARVLIAASEDRLLRVGL